MSDSVQDVDLVLTHAFGKQCSNSVCSVGDVGELLVPDQTLKDAFLVLKLVIVHPCLCCDEVCNSLRMLTRND